MGYNKKIFYDGTGASEVMAYLKSCEEVEYFATLNKFHINQLLSMISNMQDTIDKQREKLNNKSRRDDSVDVLCYANEALRTLSFGVYESVNDYQLCTVIDMIKDRIETVTVKDNEIVIKCSENHNPPTIKS